MFPVTLLHEKVRQFGLECLVIGGHAVNAYCEPRVTLDLDFLVCRNKLASWKDLLAAEGFKLDYEGPTFVRFNPPCGVEWRLDLMNVEFIM